MTKKTITQLFNYPVIRLDDTPFTRKLHRLHMNILGFAKVSAFLLPTALVAYLLFGFYVPAKINFATHTDNCIFAPTLLPNTAKVASDEHYKISMPAKISINGYPIVSTRMCAEPTTIPSSSAKTLAVSQLKLPISKKIQVTNTASLSASPRVKDGTISTKNNLIFELSKPDLFFDYELVADDKKVDCIVQGDAVSCPAGSLGLSQGQAYVFVLIQKLGSSSQELFTNELTTITSVDLVNSSITNNQIVYDAPTTIQLTLSKPVVRAGDVKIMQDTIVVPTTHTTADNVITIILDAPLERQKQYVISVGSAVAIDGGHLEAPIAVSFSTSGGPKVTGSTLPSSKSSLTVDFTLTFDHSLKPEQDFSSVVLLSSGGQPISSSYNVSGTQLRVRSKVQLASCQDFSVNIKDTLMSAYDITGGTAYSANSRTQCSRSFSIGKSVQGRDITAYSIGNGPEKVLYIGSIHGNEKSAYYLLSSWLDYLEANPGAVPAGKTIVVIPKLNPDGFASGSRFNANNVDLNRNFASASWKPDVVVPGGGTLVNGGGTSPLSEPESQAIVTYINSVGPSLIMSYHSQGSIVIANGSGNSNSLASMYASFVDYQHVATEASSEAFEHETTGALEDWLHEVPGIPVVLLELSSHSATGLFPYHKQPMLNVLR